MIGRDRDKRLGVAAGDVIESAGEPLPDRFRQVRRSRRRWPDVYPGHGFGRWASRGGWWSMGSTPGPPCLQPAKTLAMTVVIRVRKDAALLTAPGPRLSGRRGRPRAYGGGHIEFWPSGPAALRLNNRGARPV